MKANQFRRLLCAALILGGATLAHAGNERPRDTGVACARAANTYCNLQEPAAGRLLCIGGGQGIALALEALA